MKYSKFRMLNLLTKIYSFKSAFSGQIAQKKYNRILMYHSIEREIKDCTNIYTLGLNFFKEQLDSILDHPGIEVVPFKDSLSALSNNLSITFDDGHKNNLYLVAPIMEQLKIPFTVFIPTDFLKENQEYLNSSELVELSKLKFASIGSHGVTHKNLLTLDKKNIYKEVSDSKKILEDVLGSEVTSFSYPHGGVNSMIRNIVESAGYKMAATSMFGVNYKNQDRLLLKRTEIWNYDQASVFEDKLNGFWDWIAMRSYLR